MIATAVPPRDVLTLIVAGLTVCLTIFFGHFKTWRHRICFEYDGKQAAAVTAMRDKFQEEAEQHYRAVQDHIQRTGGTVQQFYADGRGRTLIKALALQLERSNRIIRLYSHLCFVSQMVEIAIFVESTLLILSIGTIWIDLSRHEHIALLVVLVGILMMVVGLIFALLYLEGRFLTATNRALRPEFD